MKRFWTTRDAQLRLDADYLADPEGPYAALLGDPDRVVALPTLEDTPCVVMLGEPGSGKTTAVAQEVERVTALAPTADCTLHFDLREFVDLADLRAAVLENSDVVRWQGGTHRLTLVLDSLDEALIDMRKLATRLITELRALPIERLRLRVACRTADWPPVLERGLGTLWGEQRIRVLEIAPLRRRDVTEIAAARLGPGRAAEFVEAVAAADAEPFAARPGTLGLLLASFDGTGRLPASQTDLYLAGCRALCEEANPSRRAARLTGQLSPDERLGVAARVAAVAILGGRTAVWMGLDRDTPTNDLRLADLVGDEPTPRGVLRVDEQLLRDEVLATGLFSARGPERLGWAHQTYGEFLAAWWLSHRRLTDEQVLALVTMHDDVGRKLVPPLRETAAWVATLRPDLFAAIARIEPAALLRSDVARAHPLLRERLVQELLDAAERNTLPAPEFGERWLYERLQHPGLGEQLLAVVADTTRSDRTRDLALELAIACRTRAVAAAAADLALDKALAMRLRVTAAQAVVAVGDDVQAARLRPLAIESEEGDDTDDLKGSALRAVWRMLTPDELFAAFTDPKRPNYSGSYERCFREVADGLADAYVAPGLRWVSEREHLSTVGEERLGAALILRALTLLDDADVRRHLARLVRRALAEYPPLVEEREERSRLMAALADSDVRRRLLSALVDDAVDAARAARAATGDGAEVALPTPETRAAPGDPIDAGFHVLTLMTSGYLVDEDFGFLLDALAGVGDAPEEQDARSIWSALALEMLDLHRAEHADAILTRASLPAVRAAFRDFIDPVDLDDPAADLARQAERTLEAERRRWADRQAELERKHAERAADVVDPAPLPSAERLAEAARTTLDLEHLSDLPRQRWIRVFFELVRDANGEIPPDGRTGDARAGVAWRDADADVRQQVIDAAALFIESAAAPELDLDVGVQHHRYAWAGYVALRLLAAEAPHRLEAIERAGSDAWRRWAATVALAEPHDDAPDEQAAHAALVHRARAAAPDMLEAAVLRMLEHALDARHWKVPRRVVVTTAATSLGGMVLARCLEWIERDLRNAFAGAPPAVATAAAPAVTVVPKPTPETKGVADSEAEVERERRAQTRDARWSAFIDVLVALLEGGSADARETLGGLLQKSGASIRLDAASALASAEGERALLAADALLTASADVDGDSGWNEVRALVEAAPQFAQALFLRMARHREVPIRRFRERLGVRTVGELFVALARAFPYETDPWHSGVYSPSARDNVTTWRRVMLEVLEGWGTDEAIAELQRIQAELPQYDWLAFSVARAREQTGRAAWRPVAPLDLFNLADQRARRLVRDQDELLELVVESLGRYQRELQGDIPAVVDLWDYSSKSAPQPRDEGHFADHVARFLRKDLADRSVAVGCELVVRRGGKGRAPGLRTDITITAAIAGDGAAGLRAHPVGELVAVVVEVKGSWHEEVLSAMRTQLVDRYLREHAGTRRGIFLVGDYTCEAWVDSATKRRSAALGGVTTLRTQLQQQADELSQGGVRVRAVVLDTSLPAA
ncbi:MAG: hypothetical protein MUE41_01245 [Gemmatimonadaceae bacterium]|nr:hypothetical protein [Gemmatimonadaceae bacterium]